MTWKPVYRDGKIRAIRIAETSQQVVRWDGVCDPTTDWGQANWRMILAAPDMLAEMEECLGMLESFQNSDADAEGAVTERVESVRKLIAKARGES